ncbi:3-phosphoglycerate dehydrogenase family protein [Acidihalobacter ferrooxydans]|uniref:3-phosphoglycerate dehydrogenase n=1 Tax=Acidihalobacter ferrooxydans TaxID=1765967 RepID=A0A1P8UG23_9GAMM|nr:3-phosphoglycerate dehydrogenase family protein [Acidihalobacter ferrooxydans]APZ42807.1 3-phosphoglycerate dehydrogenase [Acidihalobacter ferrooxydans]
MFKIRTLNNISPKGLERLPRERYEVGVDLAQPDAILLRSHDMHDMALPASLKAVARAGAGVNNIPVSRLSEQGVAVFNTPGANANAVKELVIAGMLLAARNLCQAWHYVQGVQGDAETLQRRIEADKKRFAGYELAGRTLGVIGLGAIGVQVANGARALGMHVIGFDPSITVERAWQLSSGVVQAASIEQLMRGADFVSVHVPLLETTRNLLDAERLRLLPAGAVLLNFARDGIVEHSAVLEALDAQRLRAYVCDFPDPELAGHAGVLALPHLGASTGEAEENCAVMAVEQLRDYLENGNVRMSVNLPQISLERSGTARLAIINRNVPDMLGQISHQLGQVGVNILHMVNESRGALACTLVDTDAQVDETVRDTIAAIDGVLNVRVL